MKRGILTICLACGLAWSATSRADNSANAPALNSQLQQTTLTNRMMLLKKLRRKHLIHPAVAMPGMPGASQVAAAPQPGALPTGVPAGTTQSNSVSAPPSDSDNPYASIVSRNVFGLNPLPVVDPNALPPGPPPPKITVTGITTIFGPPEALFTVAGVVRSGRPPHDESYIFTEGEAQDDVEVVSIDTKKNVVTFNNHGVQQDVPLANASASSGSAPSAPSWPGQGFRGRRFGRNFGGGSPFGGPGNFPQPYQPQSYNNGQPNGNGNPGGSPGFNNYDNNDSSGNVHNYSTVAPAIAALSDDDQQALIAAQHAQMVQENNPLAAIMPPTKYDGPAAQAAGGPGGRPPAPAAPSPP